MKIVDKIYKAINLGHIQDALKLLKKGVDLRYDHLAIFYAVEDGYAELIEPLVSSGANVNAVSYDGKTPLTCAIKNKNIRCVKILLELGASPIKLDNSDDPLDIAIRSGSIEIVDAIQTALGDSCETYDASMFIALSTYNFEMVQHIITKGANVNAKDNNGYTPLFYAIQSPKILDILLSSGADPNIKDRFGSTPLIDAITKNNIKCVELLIRAGSDLNVRINKFNYRDEQTPLFVAVQLTDKEIIELLILSGADIYAIDAEKNTLLHIAALRGKLDILHMLLNYQFNINECNSEKNTPLHMAVINGKYDAVSVLLSAGSDKEIKNNFGRTPLETAKFLKYEIVERYLS